MRKPLFEQEVGAAFVFVLLVYQRTVTLFHVVELFFDDRHRKLLMTVVGLGGWLVGGFGVLVETGPFRLCTGPYRTDERLLGAIA